PFSLSFVGDDPYTQFHPPPDFEMLQPVPMQDVEDKVHQYGSGAPSPAELAPPFVIKAPPSRFKDLELNIERTVTLQPALTWNLSADILVAVA
ncbi:MAG: hypothetical protein Q9226_003483, partial [Calogaya cf. arnoldii]